MEAIAVQLAMIGVGLVLIMFLIRWLVGKSEKGAEAKQRADALESNLEIVRDAERHVDDAPVTLSGRRARARTRRLRREAAAARLSGPSGPAGDDGEG